MSSPVQTAVQIAWVTPDLDATEAALTNLLGVRKWVRLPEVHFPGDTCTYLADPDAGVPYLEIAHVPDEIRAFFDYVNQEQQ